jgi:hypothetical protein
MRKTFIINLFIVAALLYIPGCRKNESSDKPAIPDGDYYVAPWGNDNNPGTIDQPWASWQKAFLTAEPGDVVYFRGGTYKPADDVYGYSLRITPPTPSNEYPGGTIGHNGTSSKPICYYNYPGEKPIMDYAGHEPVGNFNTGLVIEFGYFIRFRGLEIKNVFQEHPGITACGIQAVGCNNLSFENMVVHDIGGRAIGFFGGYIPELFLRGVMIDSSQFINCDAYNVCDSFCMQLNDCGSSAIGGIADGFKYDNSEHSYLLVKGCRAWHYSDNGFDITGPGYADIENCWSFKGGDFYFAGYAGEGSGIKYGALNKNITSIVKRIHNCISAENKFLGYDECNSWPTLYPLNAEIDNNISFDNEIGFGNFSYTKGREALSKFRNNLSYKDITYARGCEGDCDIIQDHNSWVSTDCSRPTAERIVVTDADFVSVDPSELSKPRKEDGSLPDINFLKPVKGSKLINAGVDVGLPFRGSAPDVGAYEIE